MKFFLFNTRLVILISLTLVFIGIKGLFHMKRESIPPVDYAKVSITTVYPGSSPVEVEELITRKIEDEIRPIEHLKEVYSVSSPGISHITIHIDMDSADVKSVVDELQKALQRVEGLPSEILDPPELHHFSSNSHPIVNILIAGSNDGRLRDKISRQLKAKLEKIPGIFEINMKNYKKREFRVLLSQRKMDKYHISSSDVISALKQKKMDLPAGHLTAGSKRKLVRVIGKPRTTRDLKNIIVRSNFSGQKVFIKDIAKVVDGMESGKEEVYFYQPMDDNPYKLEPVTSLHVTKTSKADTITLISNINQILKKLKHNLNEKYKILTGFNEGEETRNRLTTVINNALGGLVIVFIVFFLFLPSRVGFMGSFSLPLTLLGTFGLLPVLGISFNAVTMLAFVICIGMLVDNSVVITEHYARLIANGKISSVDSAWQSVHLFGKPITATALTTIAAFLPMLVTIGVMGQFIKWIPIVVTIALLMSLFECFCLLPNRLKWLPQKKVGRYQKALFGQFNQIEKWFEKVIKKIIDKKYMSLGLIFSFIVLTGVIFKWGSQIDLFSSKNPDTYTAVMKPKANTSFDVFDEQIKKAAHKVQGVFGEKTIQWMSVQVKSGELAKMTIKVKPLFLRQLKYKDILENLRKIDNEGLKSLQFSVNRRGPPVGKAFEVAFQSNNRSDIIKFVDEIFPKLQSIPGLIHLNQKPDSKTGSEYKVRVRSGLLARLGLSFQSIGLALRTALEGHILTKLIENNESFQIRVGHESRDVASFKNLKQIKIKESSGRLIPLSKVAWVKETPAEPNKESYNFTPVVYLFGDIDPKKTTSLKVNAQAKKIIEEHIGAYSSLEFNMIGEQRTTNESIRSLFRASVLAVFAIFIILIVLFKSFLLSFLILSCIPLGFIGVIWAFFLHQRPLGFFALVGVIGLAGVVVNSAIILISFILNLKKKEPETSLADIMVKASKMRFRPIVITNLTTLGGLFPTAYGIAGFEPLLMPMTLALFWGLLVATFLTLIWVPCAILVTEDIKVLMRRVFKKREEV